MGKETSPQRFEISRVFSFALTNFMHGRRMCIDGQKTAAFEGMCLQNTGKTKFEKEIDKIKQRSAVAEDQIKAGHTAVPHQFLISYVVWRLFEKGELSAYVDEEGNYLEGFPFLEGVRLGENKHPRDIRRNIREVLNNGEKMLQAHL